MYLIEESVVDDKVNGYFVREKISGQLIESHFITKDLKECSCTYFQLAKNKYNHFHINLVKNWLKLGKPKSALFAKSKKGKIVTLCPGFVLSKTK